MRSAFVLLLLAAGVLVMLPPFFTHGTCQAEFEAASALVEHAQGGLATASRAESYLNEQGISYRIAEPPPCPAGARLDSLSCPEGPKVFASIPVKDRICRFYRDDAIRVRLDFNAHRQLIRIQTDMRPFRAYRIGLLGLDLYWAR